MSVRRWGRRIGTCATALTLSMAAWLPVARAQVSCSFAVVRGDSSTISVRVDLSYLSWGITMDPMSESIGRWEVNTYAGGRKLSTGFHRVTTTPYIPHGSIMIGKDAARIKTGGMIAPGSTFKVDANLLSATGRSYVSVSNGCSVPI